jgi:ribosomal protein S12 methylthiotransferase
MALQQTISAERRAAKIGTEQQLIIDHVDSEGAIGRTRGDAPEIDGVVHLPGYTDLRPGDLVTAEITGADEYDLWVE